ncbi:hypothetical protein BVRB_4g096500 [Beta vulgaris subsp. vulgaris]|uniref:BHLH domain-containing protein n=1 Tax=Beta vulgaris subsp. vulgaris TaxID=3555 RepID=A0A0J8BDA0_BETVV|nr:hypothetical protein BVRB_4g096500 [Beta vulgaris subsp. vulgaris]
MQKEENYTGASEYEAGGRFGIANDVDNSSVAPNPTYHHQGGPGPLLSYHQPEAEAEVQGQGHNHIIHGSGSGSGSGSVVVDYMLNDPINNAIPSRTAYHHHEQPINCVSGRGYADRTGLSFADVMQFADFGPKLGLNRFQQHQQDDESTKTNTMIPGNGIDPVYFLKFPVLGNSGNTSSIHDDRNHSITDREGGFGDPLEDLREYSYDHQQEDASAAAAAGVLLTAGTSNNSLSNYTNPVQLEFLGNTHDVNDLMDLSTGEKSGANVELEGMEAGGEGAVAAAAAMGHNKSSSSSSKRKRPRTIKTNEEVESQRMTHIAVERNRRKQMNEHLRVLRSLMPSSYVQRGDQASIIGGAIEFVRELEQLLQCLESQKRRRLYGDQGRPIAMGDSNSNSSSSTTVLGVGLVQQMPQVQPPLALAFTPPNHQAQDDDQLRLLVDHQLDPDSSLLPEETAESKSCIADVEVKVLGFDALIKILSRRRPGQLIKAIAALEDLHFTILHTNITTIEQTVLYSFNVKVANEARFTADDIASSVQQIFTFIHSNTNIN